MPAEEKNPNARKREAVKNYAKHPGGTHKVDSEKETKVAKGKYEPRGEMEKEREKPGQGSAGKYKNVSEKNFAGPHHTYPINTEARGRNALTRAHFSPHPETIKEKVYEKYPGLKERKKEREGLDAKKYDTYKSR